MVHQLQRYPMNQPFKPNAIDYDVTLGANGRMNLPADLRQRMGIKAPGRLVIELDENGVATFVSFDHRLKQIQAMLRANLKPGQSVVDELIADRRAEAAKEEAESAEWHDRHGG